MRLIRLTLLLATLIAVIAACSGSEEAEEVDPEAVPAKSVIGVFAHPEFGDILVDGEEMTLYLFTSDGPGTTFCTEGCLSTWAPLAAPGGASQGARADLIGKFEREAGDQVTYNGHKLYNFAGDGIPGEAFGQGFGRTWFVVSPDGEQIIIGVDPMTTTK